MNKAHDSAEGLSRTPGLLRRILHRLFSWDVMRRCLFVLACLATLVGLFYAVENWRGKRAWEKCRRELEAKGEVLEWSALIPAPVPDDQNIFKAPKMTEWFVKGSLAEAFPTGPSKPGNTNAPFSLLPSWNTKRAPVLLAEVDVVPPDGPLPSGKADAVWRYDDPASHEQAAKLLDDLAGPRMYSAQGGVIVARTLDRTNSLHLVLRADIKPTIPGLSAFLSPGLASENKGTASGRSYFQVEARGNNAFQVSLLPAIYSATDYLAWSQPAVPDLDLLRKAVKRPCARMDSDYQRPFEHPVPDFIRMRNVAQILEQRVKCYLLLGQPEAAWHELALVRDMCRMLEAKPASNCATLVDAMIDVAINGLYTRIIQDGLRLHAWREPELVAMQKQLMDINLLPLLRAWFNAERAAACRSLSATTPAELKKSFFSGRESPGLWQKFQNPIYLLLTFAPRGWIYQNMCADADLEQMVLAAFDVLNDQVFPNRFDNILSGFGAPSKNRSPYAFIARTAIPNFIKAIQRTAQVQSLVNEAFIACGLERYRLTHGQYPESLDALVPQFAAKLPHDIIGGQPLKYHRTAEGRFVLYSVGWNEKDDGGVAGKAVEEGDWVWH
jgi:hypothetical protein